MHLLLKSRTVLSRVSGLVVVRRVLAALYSFSWAFLQCWLLAPANLCKTCLLLTLVIITEPLKWILFAYKNVCLYDMDMDSCFLCLQRSHVKSPRRLQPSPTTFYINSRPSCLFSRLPVKLSKNILEKPLSLLLIALFF